MSDEMTPREALPGATLTCAAGVMPERLSAWRDGLLSDDQAEWLAAHAPDCPACSARLRDYNQIGAALRAQVIPRSGDDPWPAMRRLLERERRSPRRPRLSSIPRWGGLGALGAAALLVALFAGLLAHQAQVRTTPTSTATVVRATATATTAVATPATPPGAWASIEAYRNVTGLVVAPSDPRVAYQILLNQQKGSAATIQLRRTDDQGMTWSNLTLPSIAGVTYPTDIEGPFTGFVSPVDARVVYLVVGVNTSTTCGYNGVAVGRYCQLEYVSADGGQSWRPLQLPAPGLMISQLLKHAEDGGDIQAQGTRLYSEEVDWQLGMSGIPPPARLLASDDGGLTWRLIDAPFKAAGQGVYDYAATPSGSTLFVATEPLGQQIGQPVAQPLQLWRSNDAGASWTRIGQPPNNGLLTMQAAMDVATNTPILYIETADSKGQYLIQGSRNGENGGFTASPRLSTSGQDFPQYVFLTTLADGSLVVSDNGAIESWNLTDKTTSWRQVAQSVNLLSYASVFTQKQADGSTLLWLVGTTYSESVVERTQLLH